MYLSKAGGVGQGNQGRPSDACTRPTQRPVDGPPAPEASQDVEQGSHRYRGQDLNHVGKQNTDPYGLREDSLHFLKRGPMTQVCGGGREASS